MPAPYDSPEGYHRHRCDRCGYVWEHATRWPPPPGIHVCPGCCAVEVRDHYRGREAPRESTRPDFRKAG